MPTMTDTTLIASASTLPEWHIASLAVHVHPVQLLPLKQWLAAQAQVELHAENAQGKLVLVLETPHSRAISQLLDALQQQPGVISAALVYHEIITEEQVSP